MGATTQKFLVTGCRKLSIRKDPDIDVEKEDSNVEDSEEIVAEIDRGETLEADTSKIYYDWKGRSFYKVWTKYGIEGYAAVDALTSK